eukprot:COSAG02_NODE_2897_length_7780_cov_2.267934_7_plen_220_part_00
MQRLVLSCPEADICTSRQPVELDTKQTHVRAGRHRRAAPGYNGLRTIPLTSQPSGTRLPSARMSGERSAFGPLGMQVSARYLFRQRRCSLDRFSALQASLQTVTTCRPRVYLSMRCGNHTGALAGRRRIRFSRGAISCTARPAGLFSTSVDPSDHRIRSLQGITVPSLRCSPCAPANQPHHCLTGGVENSLPQFDGNSGETESSRAHSTHRRNVITCTL